jgi:hypothetical protein
MTDFRAELARILHAAFWAAMQDTDEDPGDKPTMFNEDTGEIDGIIPRHVFIRLADATIAANLYERGVTDHRWLPADPEAEPPRQPMPWDRRPFPGCCDYRHNGIRCGNQATSVMGYWDGGAPGAGEYHHRARCSEHLG